MDRSQMGSFSEKASMDGFRAFEIPVITGKANRASCFTELVTTLPKVQ